MNGEASNNIKIPFIGGTILLTLLWFVAFVFFGILTAALGDEHVFFQLTIVQIGMWLIPALLYVFCAYNNPLNDLKIKNFGKRADYGWFILVYLITLPLVGYFAEMSEYLPFPESWIESSRSAEAKTKELILQFVSDGTFKKLISALLVMAILPAICEEVFFRGVVLNNLVKRNVGIHLAVWISAILFSAVHFDALGFLSRTLLGAAFGYAFVYSKSLWLPIILHFLNNGFLVVTAFFYHNEFISEDFSDTSIVPHWAAALCLITLAILSRFIFCRNKVRSNSE
jgi:membrane protease YdiL (CAAX protease family)